mmetsp:Transcript_24614/g.37413  ORF Transcript_24614/g.37413 Transcript_24614/m.37413 type:complete len:98 (-) Transcript_24614:404-697(-)
MMMAVCVRRWRQQQQQQGRGEETLLSWRGGRIHTMRYWSRPAPQRQTGMPTRCAASPPLHPPPSQDDGTSSSSINYALFDNAITRSLPGLRTVRRNQ